MLGKEQFMALQVGKASSTPADEELRSVITWRKGGKTREPMRKSQNNPALQQPVLAITNPDPWELEFNPS